jgi:hypothetical protein
MRYLISMTVIDERWNELPSEEQERIFKQHDEYRAALEAAGRFVASYPLAPRSEAKTVRRDAQGAFAVEDGPYTQAAEYVGGLYVIEADSLDEAVEWARRGRFMFGANEVRALA